MGMKFYSALLERLNFDMDKSHEFAMRPVNLVDWAAASEKFNYLQYLTENTELIGTTHAME
jgi:hypothetical protein